MADTANRSHGVAVSRSVHAVDKDDVRKLFFQSSAQAQAETVASEAQQLARELQRHRAAVSEQKRPSSVGALRNMTAGTDRYTPSELFETSSYRSEHDGKLPYDREANEALKEWFKRRSQGRASPASSMSTSSSYTDHFPRPTKSQRRLARAICQKPDASQRPVGVPGFSTEINSQSRSSQKLSQDVRLNAKEAWTSGSTKAIDALGFTNDSFTSQYGMDFRRCTSAPIGGTFFRIVREPHKDGDFTDLTLPKNAKRVPFMSPGL
mmetsp:Transcript_47677/g.85832  ORF Transcript_47677/g.85832 Transcript_47677/m.85832 type:complete len:265 (+) Transcript_47677:53-847(+)|eukprot:CAMPEP_0197631014 /NCGR_PEP_ID=MMETSP1338-20131121/8325_1 /TAXON_ID=43686 ORGANISM="Pelagodinium beii, Strain RCC1491" /NCGR_SAMPLE_ID=MMETSP1338 /ASSEMBLY_ACC=CAM_ASM_000754 /LENGTH=264 /DNA_ID=CAMNT_0043202381 /DNA_START=53 /DNA_END=847 /DNA_ORIENTATION=+